MYSDPPELIHQYRPQHHHHHHHHHTLHCVPPPCIPPYATLETASTDQSGGGGGGYRTVPAPGGMLPSTPGSRGKTYIHTRVTDTPGSGGGIHCHSNSSSGGSDLSREDVNKIVLELQAKLKRLKESVGYFDEPEDAIYERIDDRLRIRKRERKPDTRTYVKRAAQGRGLFRLRFLVDRETHICSRVILAILLVVCLGLLIYQVREHFLKFTSFPIYTSMETRYLERVVFPAVTICNLNMLRLTSVIQYGLYETLFHIYHKRKPISFLEKTAAFQRLNMTYMEFLQNASHPRKDFIHSCHWRDGLCSPVNFTPTMTELGLCHTFRPPSSAQFIDKPGPSSGLYLVLNVEQYEYLLGPRSSVGVRVFVHDSRKHPNQISNSIEVPVGKHTTIEIQRVRHIDSPRQYDHCVGVWRWFRDTWPSNGDPCRPCDPSDDVNCQCVPEPTPGARLAEAHTRMAGSPDKLLVMDKKCECVSSCDRVDYEMFVSHAGLPSYGVLNLRRTLEERRNLETKIETARDVYHQVDKAIYGHDVKMLTTIASRLRSEVNRIEQFTADLNDQIEKYNEVSTDLADAVRELNISLAKHHNNFKSLAHMSFAYLLLPLKSHMDQIAVKGSVLVPVQTVSNGNTRTLLKEIMSNLRHLILTDDKGWLSSIQYIPAIQKGIIAFRNDILIGYGQQYKEFRDSKGFYEDKINKISNITDSLTRTLRAGYAHLKNVSVLPSTRHGLVNRVLQNFFKGTVNGVNMKIAELSSEFKGFTENYTQHATRISELGNHMPELMRNITTPITKVKDYFTSLKVYTFGLNASLVSLLRKMADMEKEYQAKNFGKSDLSKMLQNEKISRVLKHLAGLLQNVTSNMASIRDQGQYLVLALKPFASRLSDFKLMSFEDLRQHMRWLSFSVIQVEMEHMKTDLQNVIRIISNYQSELGDFAKGNRLDEDFYRSNYLQLELYFPELSEQVIEHRLSYSIFDFACDLGGAMALYMGASVLTAFDLADFLICMLKIPFNKNKK